MNYAQKGRGKPIKERGEVREEIAELRISETEHERAKKELRRYRDNLESVVKERTSALVGASSQRRGKIAERRRVDEELLESGKLFKAVFESATEGILLADISTKKFVYGNRTISRMLGYDLDEIRTLGVADIHPEEDLRRVLDRFEKFAQTQVSSSEGLRVRRKDGSIFYADITSYRMKVGAKKYAAGIFRDVTERKQVEEELKKSERKFRAIFDNTSDGIFLVDLRARKFFMCNATCATMLGYTQGEFSNLDIADIHPGEDLPFIYEQIGKFSRGEEGIRSDIRFKRKDGGIFVADLSPALLTIAEKEYLVISFRDITERKRAEEALRASEQRFRALVETTSDFVWEIDQNCFYTYASPKIKDLLGYDPEEVIGKMPFDLMPLDEAERVAKLFSDFAKSGKPFATLEHAHLHKDGRRVVLETSGVPIFDARGDLAGYRGIDRNITERKLAEEVLRASEQRFRGLVEATSDFVWEVDQNCFYTYVSPKVMDLLGYDPEEVIGKTPFDLMPPDEAERIAKLFWDITESRKPFAALENTNVHKDGRRVVLETSGVPIFDARGDLAGYRGIDRDITERKQAEENYRSIFENAVVGIYQSTPEGQFLAVNPAFARILGYESPRQIIEMAGGAAQRFYVDKRKRRAFERLLSLHGKVHDLEFQAYRRDGMKIWIKENARVVRDSKGRVAYYEGFVEDITVQKDAEEALKQAARRVIEAQEAERKRVARGLHDSVGQLLSSARFRLSSAGEKIFDQTQRSYPELDASRTLIEKAVQEIRLIIHNLRPAVLDDLGLLPAVRTLCEEFRERANMKLKLRSKRELTRFAPEIELALFRIVQEALNNIEKHSRATRVSVSVFQREASLGIKVKDNGVGFDYHAACKRKSNSSGYGLPIIMDRAASIGGKVEVVTAVGKGTEVIVRIPLNGSGRCD